MKELSIFIDESGDFGEYDHHSPYYIIGMVFHDQSIDIYSDIKNLETELSYINLPNPYIHVGPIIRKESDYEYMEIKDRKTILKRIMAFFRKAPIHCKAFYIEKKQAEDSVKAIGMLSKQISSYTKEHYQFFLTIDKIKIYYDNGQVEVNKMLSSVFNSLLDNVEFIKIIPSNYRLSQVADLVCALKLCALKDETKSLSRSEMLIFGNERTLRKNYLKPFFDKEYTPT